MSRSNMAWMILFIGWATVLSIGWEYDASGILSKPMSEISSGTRIPRRVKIERIIKAMISESH